MSRLFFITASGGRALAHFETSLVDGVALFGTRGPVHPVGPDGRSDRDGGGIDGGSGIYFANAGEDVHAVGSLAPLAPAVGCIVIRSDGTRVLARVERDPLAEAPE